MAEELLVKCRKCGLVYDKLKNRACPKCEPRVRPGSVPPAEASAAPEPRAGAPEGATASAAPRLKGKVDGTTQRPALPKAAVALVAGVALGFGAARFLATRAAPEPVLLPLPTPSASTRAETAPAAPQGAGARPAPTATGGPAAAPGPIEPAVVTGADGKAPAHPIELLDARRGAPRPDGTLEYTAVLVNRTANTVKELRLRGLGEDKKGHQVVTAEVAVEPEMVGAGREATARLVVPDGTVLHEYAVTGWVQHGAMVRLEAPIPAPETKHGATLRPFPPSTAPDPADVDPAPEPEGDRTPEGGAAG
ncbi:MAG: hypothetical protein IPK07_03870 [Deltaproteobacteria bacterium]|nr:hypothetical protein [Deltaproteobacteria bacterium]